MSPGSKYSAESEARKALNRLRRAIEKAQRELGELEGALRHAEGSDFPAQEYADIREQMNRALDFLETEASRLQEKILSTGGLEPGRVRRSR
ncbi:MAG: hypothetical protein V3S01_10815 [Dehalococcoidia bacterium]